MSNRQRIKDKQSKLRGKKRLQVAMNGLAKKVTIPGDEVKVIKEVPAMVDGVEVGVAYIHDDGSVGIRYHEDLTSPEQLAALEKIKATEAEVGYSLEMGEFTDGSP